MFRRLLLSYVPRKIYQASSINVLQSVRCTATVTADLDDMDLASAKPYEEVPSLKMLPFIGTGWAFLPIIGRYDPKNFNKNFEDKRLLLGDVFKEKFGSLDLICSFNPDDLKTIYQHEGTYPHRNELESMKVYKESKKDYYSSAGLLILNGKEWHEFRKRVQKHLMKPKEIFAFLDPMQEVARDLVKRIQVVRDANNEVPDFLDELYKWGLESVALVGLDTRLGCLERNLLPDSDGLKMINSVQTMFSTMSTLETLSGTIPLWKYFPTPTWKKFEKACDTFTEIALKHITRSLEKLKNSSKDQDLTLLQSLVLEKGMDLSSAMVMVSDMLLAGIDTTSNSIGFFLYHMAKNPDKQELLYQDLKRVLPEKEVRVTPSVYNELKYLKACIKEAQRLNPVAGGIARSADHDVVISGYRVPAGTLIFVCLQGVYKDEKYFSNPKAYLPERWLEKDEKFHPFAYVPFGFGVRSCVGRRLAELEMISVATELIRNFKIEYHHEDIGMNTRLVNVPDKPLRFNFIER